MFQEKIKKKIYFLLIMLIFAYVFYIMYIFFNQFYLKLEGFGKTNSLVTTQKTFIFKGKAENIKKIYLNGKEISLNPEHEFQKKVYLFLNENDFIFRFITKVGTEKTQKILIYRQ